MSNVGFIGLGIMGKPMALNLLKAGVPLLVCDLEPSAVAQLVSAGAQSADYETIGARCDVIMTILPNGQIVKDVLFGKNGVAKTLRKGAVVCDMSSVTPVESVWCYSHLKALGADFVDAPVSGGEPGAMGATLAFMAGGEAQAYERMLPYFNMMGKSSVLVGGPGSGSVAKLVNQIIVNNSIAIVSEAFVFAVKAGADSRKVYEAIRGGLAGSAVLDAKVPLMIDRNFKPGGKISINHKDIKNVIDTAHAMDIPVPYSAQLFEILQALKIHGHMNDDHGGIVQYFEALADAQVGQGQTIS